MRSAFVAVFFMVTFCRVTAHNDAAPPHQTGHREHFAHGADFEVRDSLKRYDKWVAYRPSLRCGWRGGRTSHRSHNSPEGGSPFKLDFRRCNARFTILAESICLQCWAAPAFEGRLLTSVVEDDSARAFSTSRQRARESKRSTSPPSTIPPFTLVGEVRAPLQRWRIQPSMPA